MNDIIKKTIILATFILIIFLCCIGTYYYTNEKIREEKEFKIYSLDKTFYLQDGNLFVLDSSKNYIQVPGNFSQMRISDYNNENYKSNINTTGGVYFYYNIDEKIYLVRSISSNYTEWQTKELTSDEVGIPSNSKIKYIRISGSYGYIFYIDENGVGGILKSTTQGNYWNRVNIPFELNDKCELKFLNKFGMTVDGFLQVPSEDGSKSDLYAINDNTEETFRKIDITYLNNTDKQLDYYHMPSYLDDSSMAIVMMVGESKDDSNIERFVSRNSGSVWITEREYYNQIQEEKDNNDEIISNFNKMVDSLDENIFLKNFNNYNINSNEVKITEKKAKEIANKGFEECAKRIAQEGITDTEKEYIKIEEVSPNNFFTRKYREYDNVYTNIKRKSYVVSKENDMGNGVYIYVDATTGLIIGGGAFGD